MIFAMTSLWVDVTNPLIHKAIIEIVWDILTYIFTEYWPTIHVYIIFLTDF